MSSGWSYAKVHSIRDGGGVCDGTVRARRVRSKRSANHPHSADANGSSNHVAFASNQGIATRVPIVRATARCVGAQSAANEDPRLDARFVSTAGVPRHTLWTLSAPCGRDLSARYETICEVLRRMKRDLRKGHVDDRRRGRTEPLRDAPCRPLRIPPCGRHDNEVGTPGHNDDTPTAEGLVPPSVSRSEEVRGDYMRATIELSLRWFDAHWEAPLARVVHSADRCELRRSARPRGRHVVRAKPFGDLPICRAWTFVSTRRESAFAHRQSPISHCRPARAQETD